MSIEFSEIQPTRIPGVYVEINTKLAARGLPKAKNALVLIGQKTASGTGAADTPVQIYSDADAETYGGPGSMLHRMALAAFATNKYMSEVWVVPVADHSGGVLATGSFAFTASSLTAGVLTISVGADSVQMALTGVETAAQVAATVKAALDGMSELPVTTGSISSATLPINAKNKGTLGNKIKLAASYSGSGLTTTVTSMASGATDPDLQGALDALASADVQIFALGNNDATNLGALVDALDERSDGINQRGAIGVSAFDGTVSSAAALGLGLNSGRVSVAGIEGSSSYPPDVAGAYAAAVAGATDLAKPLNGAVLKTIAAPDISYRFTRSELTTLLANGIAPLVVNTSGDVVVLRSITTYVTNASGIADDALLDLQTIRVLDYYRLALRERLIDRFQGKKIADVAHTAGTTDPSKILAECVSLTRELEAIDYVEKVDDLAEQFVVERNADDATRVDIYIPTNIVNGLHVMAAQIHLVSL